MTAPIPHGYPDWGRVAAVSDKIIYADTPSGINGLVTYDRVFVGDAPFIGMALRPTTHHFEFRFLFYDDESAGNLLTGQFFSVRNGSDLMLTIPVAGPWLEMSALPSTSGAAFDRTVWTASSANLYDRNNFVGSILLNHNANVGAGTTVSVSATRVAPGEAYWSVRSLATNWEMRLETVDYTGTVRRIENASSLGSAIQRGGIFLPPIDARVTLVNNDAASAFMFFSLTARPMAPGW